jgi:chloramphenicol-sensitive protein RarD
LTVTTETDEERIRHGMLSAFLAFFLWGLLPIYFKLIEAVPALEVLAHRIIWAVPFGALIVAARKQWPEVRRVIGDRRTLGLLTITAVIIALNWLIYIYAVQQEQIFQSSLGYYINPLLFALVGVFFFGEKLSRNKTIAIGLAAVGVLVLTFSGEEVPVIALALAVLFTIYGTIRKQVVAGGMAGLFVETLILLPLALLYMGWAVDDGTAVFGAQGMSMSIALILAGPFTVLPLLFFALGARRLKLSTIGIMQFLAPTMHFLIGLYYGEQFTLAHAICFGCIWIAVSLFAWDAWKWSRAMRSAHR